MKTIHFTVVLWFLPLTLVVGQTLVEDPALINVTIVNHSEVMIALEEQLATARDQLLRMEEQLRVMGDPSQVVTVSGVAEANEAMSESKGEGLKSNDELAEMIENIEPSALFIEDLYGMAEPIGDTFEQDGETFQRNGDFYKPEAAMLDRIRDYQRVRQASLERRDKLQEAMIETLDRIQRAEDFATIQKHRAVIDVLQTQIAAADSEIGSAAKDVEILQQEFLNQANAIRKATSERTPKVESSEDAEDEAKTDLNAIRNPRMRWGPESGN